MNKSTAWPLVFFVILVVVAILTRPASKGRVAAKYLIDNNLTSNGVDGLEGQITEAMDLVSQGTRFESRYVINRLPKKGEVAVIVFLGPKLKNAPHAPELLHTLISNCAAVDGEFIFCDAWFLRQFLKKRRILQSQAGILPGRRNTNLSSLLTWVLAHEMGHLLLGHSSRSQTNHAFEATESIANYSHRREFEADEYVTTLLGRHDRLEYEIMQLFSDMLGQEIAYSTFGSYPRLSAEFLGGPTFGHSGIVEYANNESHPHFILRLCRLVELVGNFEKPGNHVLLEEIRPLINNLREKSE